MDPTQPPAPTGQDDPCPHCHQPVGDAWLVCAWCGEQLAAPAELAVGASLAGGRYQVLGIIGRGGFGITYDVGDTRLKRRVAVKELFPESAVRHGSMVLTPPHARASFRASRDRFLREARVLARFTHPGIVRVYEVFEEHGTAYLVMERLGGRTLVDVLRTRSRPFEEAEVLDVAGRVAAALRPVHAAGVLHRDVNPSNVMLTEHGRIVVIDFGLARDFDPEQTVGMTRVVTPGYAPLEQYRGEGRFGPSTDVYGLAATCYRLATGKVPVAAIERDAGADLPSPAKLNPAISKAVSDAILDGLELEPGHRPQDLDSFLARLQIRRLPDAPRSILLGTLGAEPADLATVADLSDLSDPGPAMAGGRIAPAAPGDGHGDGDQEPADATVAGNEAEAAEAAEPGADPVRPSALLTEVVGPSAGGSGRTVVDPDRTEVPPQGTVVAGDPDLTAVPDADPDRTYVPAGAGHLVAPSPPLPSSAARGPVPAERPGEVGLRRPGRRKVTWPLAALAVSTASAAPLLVTAFVVVVALPAVATLGDASAQRLRAENGFAAGWAERRLPHALLAPVRFLRNVVISVVRTSPVVGVAAFVTALWYALSTTSFSPGVVDGLLRLVGASTVAAVLLTSREGSSRFRTGLGIDELVARSVPDGRTSERVVIAWLIIGILVTGAIWLDPSPFPLP